MKEEETLDHALEQVLLAAAGRSDMGRPQVERLAERILAAEPELKPVVADALAELDERGRLGSDDCGALQFGGPRQGALAPLGVDASTVDRLRSTSAPPRPMDALLASWAEAAEVDVPEQHRAFEHLMNGRCAPWIEPDQGVRIAYGWIRELGLWSPDHRIELNMHDAGFAAAIPLRLPGRTYVCLPAWPGVGALQRAAHELAHAGDHATRRSSVPIARRWAADPVVSELLALAVEARVDHADSLQAAGLSADRADQARAVSLAGREMLRALFAALAWVADELAAGRGDAAVARVMEAIGTDWPPGFLLHLLRRELHLRSYVAAWDLLERHGSGDLAALDRFTRRVAAAASRGATCEELDVSLRPSIEEATP